MLKNELLSMGKLFSLTARKISIRMLCASRCTTNKPVGESNRTLQPAWPCHNMLNNVMSLLRDAHNNVCTRLHTTYNSLMTPECWAVRSESRGWTAKTRGGTRDDSKVIILEVFPLSLSLSLSLLVLYFLYYTLFYFY